MILEHFSDIGELRSALEMYRKDGRTSDVESVMFISAGNEIEIVSDLLHEAFFPAVVFGVHSTMLVKGKVDKEGIILAVFDKKQKEFEYTFGLIDRASTDPTSSIIDIQKKVDSIHPGNEDTICLEFCTGGEEYLVTTLNSVMQKHGIQVFGSSVWNIDPSQGKSVIYYDGRIYEDACVYVLIHNCCGRIRTYLQNIYCHHTGGRGHIVTKVDRKTRALIELDNRPAADVYCEEMNITRDQIMDKFAYHPFGKDVGDKTYTVSMRSIGEDGRINLYKQVERNDLLYIMDLGDYKKIIREQLQEIKKEIPDMSAVITIDCLHRYYLFQMEDYIDEYLHELNTNFTRTFGLVGAGEQCSDQAVNQTMICAVFERRRAESNKEKKLAEIKKYPEKGSMDARIYPVSYLLKYVSETKDELVNQETSVMQYLLDLQRLIDGQMDEDDPEKLKEFLKSIKYGSKSVFEHIARMNLHIGDISNMLDQAEYLVGDVIFRDGLTGLLNRYFYNVNGERAFKEAGKTNGLSIAFFDIDDFKHYNTEYGHDFGDRLLSELAEDLMYFFRNDHKVYPIRMGGDEFMIMNVGDLSYNEFVSKMEEVRNMVSDKTISYKGKDIRFSISIGMSHTITDRLTNLRDLYIKADERLYVAKNAGKNRSCSA